LLRRPNKLPAAIIKLLSFFRVLGVRRVVPARLRNVRFSLDVASLASGPVKRSPRSRTALQGVIPVVFTVGLYVVFQSPVWGDIGRLTLLRIVHVRAPVWVTAQSM
jgi:hypothetical protein